jgi:hypothetical protein
MNLGKFLHLRLQGASMDTPVFNDPGTAVVGGSMALGALSGKKGGTTTQTSEPWGGVKPFLYDLYDQARGQFFAPQQAQGMIAQRALDGNSLVGQAQDQLGNTLRGDYLNPERNPAFRASIQDALGLAGSTFAKQYGGAAGQNLGNSGYQEALARGLGATATNAYANAYGQERQNQLNAMQLAPSIGFADLNQLAASEQMPWQRLAGYQAALSGSGGGTTQTPYFQNPLATAMGMGIGGLTMYNGMNQANMFGKSPFQSNADLAAMYNF